MATGNINLSVLGNVFTKAKKLSLLLTRDCAASF